MNEKLKILIGLLVFLVMPVVMGVILAKAIANHNGILLLIIFFTLLALELFVVVFKIVKYKKSKEEDE